MTAGNRPQVGTPASKRQLNQRVVLERLRIHGQATRPGSRRHGPVQADGRPSAARLAAGRPRPDGGTHLLRRGRSAVVYEIDPAAERPFRGLMEAAAAARSIVDTALDAGLDGVETAREVFTPAREGEPRALRVVEHEAEARFPRPLGRDRPGHRARGRVRPPPGVSAPPGSGGAGQAMASAAALRATRVRAGARATQRRLGLHGLPEHPARRPLTTQVSTR
jgi:hypothetical protein